ncbi:MAG: hypothetical protein RR894_18605 [Terrisporobacter sp.]
MAKKKYSELEQKVINVFKEDGGFNFNNNYYSVIKVDKPTTKKGECKTDVYVSGKSSTNELIELKISVKTENSNEFQENKCTDIKMESYFGENWENIIKKASKSISTRFEKLPLIYVSGKYPTKPNSITLGWKLEITTKERNLCAPAPLTDKEIKEFVFKGTNLSIDKKNAYVCNDIIVNSGVADYLLITKLNKINSTSDVINQMQLIDNITPPKCYLTFTANNYRTKEDTADGKRALAVYINWKCVNNKLIPEINYDKPLNYTGEEDMKPLLLKALKTLGKSHPCDFDVKNDIEDNKMILL